MKFNEANFRQLQDFIAKPNDFMTSLGRQLDLILKIIWQEFKFGKNDAEPGRPWHRKIVSNIQIADYFANGDDDGFFPLIVSDDALYGIEDFIGAINKENVNWTWTGQDAQLKRLDTGSIDFRRHFPLKFLFMSEEEIREEVRSHIINGAEIVKERKEKAAAERRIRDEAIKKALAKLTPEEKKLLKIKE